MSSIPLNVSTLTWKKEIAIKFPVGLTFSTMSILTLKNEKYRVAIKFFGDNDNMKVCVPNSSFWMDGK